MLANDVFMEYECASSSRLIRIQVCFRGCVGFLYDYDWYICVAYRLMRNPVRCVARSI